MHRSRRQIAAVVFQIIERRGLNIDRRIPWCPMKGKSKKYRLRRIDKRVSSS